MHTWQCISTHTPTTRVSLLNNYFVHLESKTARQKFQKAGNTLTTRTVVNRIAVSKLLKYNVMGCPIIHPNNTISGATSSAICYLSVTFEDVIPLMIQLQHQWLNPFYSCTPLSRRSHAEN